MIIYVHIYNYLYIYIYICVISYIIVPGGTTPLNICCTATYLLFQKPYQ